MDLGELRLGALRLGGDPLLLVLARFGLARVSLAARSAAAAGVTALASAWPGRAWALRTGSATAPPPARGAGALGGRARDGAQPRLPGAPARPTGPPRPAPAGRRDGARAHRRRAVGVVDRDHDLAAGGDLRGARQAVGLEDSPRKARRSGSTSGSGLSLAPTVMVCRRTPTSRPGRRSPEPLAADPRRQHRCGDLTVRQGRGGHRAESGRDWIAVVAHRRCHRPPLGQASGSGRIRFRIRCERVSRTGRDRTASVLQAAEAPPISPMRRKRDSAPIPLPVPRSPHRRTRTSTQPYDVDSKRIQVKLPFRGGFAASRRGPDPA